MGETSDTAKTTVMRDSTSWQTLNPKESEVALQESADYGKLPLLG